MQTMEENMKLGRKLALLAAARPKYAEKIMDTVNKKKCDYCWSGWTYRIDENKLNILKNQFDRDGYFHLYYHDIKKPKETRYGRGTGSLYQLVVKNEDYRYNNIPFLSPEQECTASRDKGKPHRLYVCVSKKPEPIPNKRWNTLIDYDKNNNISHFKWNIPDAYFGYIDDS